MYFVALVVFVLSAILVGCSSSPTSPSETSSTPSVSRNELPDGSYSVSVTDSSGNTVSGEVTFGSTINLSMNQINCEKPSNFYGNQYVRDDGMVRKPTSGYPCSVLGSRMVLSDKLIELNDIWSFGRGHKVRLEFVIMEQYPNPVYSKPVAELVFSK